MAASSRATVLRALGSSLRALASAVLWFNILSIAGASLMVAGVHFLLGTGWALIAGGVFITAAAWFIRRGLTNG